MTRLSYRSLSLQFPFKWYISFRFEPAGGVGGSLFRHIPQQQQTGFVEHHLGELQYVWIGTSCCCVCDERSNDATMLLRVSGWWVRTQSAVVSIMVRVAGTFTFGRRRLRQQQIVVVGA